jgi:hypothetical protein
MKTYTPNDAMGTTEEGEMGVWGGRNGAAKKI